MNNTAKVRAQGCTLTCTRCGATYTQMPGLRCPRCGEPFAALQHVDDLKVVLDQLGFDYGIGTAGSASGDNYQDTCPACRRRQFALAQSVRVGGFG